MILSLLLSLLLLTSPNQELIKIEVAEDIFMSVPSDFRPMTDDEIVSKYYSIKKPFVLLTNRDLTIDLGINKSSTQWDAKDIDMMVKFQKASIFSLYDQVDILSEGSKTINDKKFVYIEFESIVNADPESIKNRTPIKKYTYLQYVIIGEQTFLFNFTAPIRLKSQWQDTVVEIMESVIFKGKMK